jgi:hypothetical protein
MSILHPPSVPPLKRPYGHFRGSLPAEASGLRPTPTPLDTPRRTPMVKGRENPGGKSWVFIASTQFGPETVKKRRPSTSTNGCSVLIGTRILEPSFECRWRGPWAYGKGGHGLPKVSTGPTMPDPSIPCGQASPETALRPFLVEVRPQSERPAAVFYPFGHPTPYAYGWRGLFSTFL